MERRALGMCMWEYTLHPCVFICTWVCILYTFRRSCVHTCEHALVLVLRRVFKNKNKNKQKAQKTLWFEVLVESGSKSESRSASILSLDLVFLSYSGAWSYREDWQKGKLDLQHGDLEQTRAHKEKLQPQWSSLHGVAATHISELNDSAVLQKLGFLFWN